MHTACIFIMTLVLFFSFTDAVYIAADNLSNNPTNSTPAASFSMSSRMQNELKKIK